MTAHPIIASILILLAGEAIAIVAAVLLMKWARRKRIPEPMEYSETVRTRIWGDHVQKGEPL